MHRTKKHMHGVKYVIGLDCTTTMWYYITWQAKMLNLDIQGFKVLRDATYVYVYQNMLRQIDAFVKWWFGINLKMLLWGWNVPKFLTFVLRWEGPYKKIRKRVLIKILKKVTLSLLPFFFLFCKILHQQDSNCHTLPLNPTQTQAPFNNKTFESPSKRRPNTVQAQMTSPQVFLKTNRPIIETNTYTVRIFMKRLLVK